MCLNMKTKKIFFTEKDLLLPIPPTRKETHVTYEDI